MAAFWLCAAFMHDINDYQERLIGLREHIWILTDRLASRHIFPPLPLKEIDRYYRNGIGARRRRKFGRERFTLDARWAFLRCTPDEEEDWDAVNACYRYGHLTWKRFTKETFLNYRLDIIDDHLRQYAFMHQLHPWISTRYLCIICLVLKRGDEIRFGSEYHSRHAMTACYIYHAWFLPILILNGWFWRDCYHCKYRLMSPRQFLPGDWGDESAATSDDRKRMRNISHFCLHYACRVLLTPESHMRILAPWYGKRRDIFTPATRFTDDGVYYCARYRNAPPEWVLSQQPDNMYRWKTKTCPWWRKESRLARYRQPPQNFNARPRMSCLVLTAWW